jgi:saccharopine dehydrogenase-like NADP-dependent oxidoreductase
MKKLFLILSLLLLNSCGSLISASLTETLFNPSSIASSLIDYGIKKHTGKKMSEHALSIVTDKDCEINIENLNKPQSFCKNKEIVENNKTTSKIEASFQTRNNKTSLALIAPKLKTLSSQKPSTSNEVYLLSLNEVLHKDFNSFGIRRSN